MNRRAYKALLLLTAVVCISAAGVMQHLLNGQRKALGITGREPLKNAPPVLALTTQVLGGFRGLIANALWLRATDMQDEGKYFEMVQLADWITKLEPHFVQVWLVQAWNMAYNISVKFSDHADRWRWVRSGIELLRDEGLRYNPNEPLIYRELAWFFQHKMGQNLDDAHVYYKGVWAQEMMEVFGGERPNFERLITPQTPDERRRAELLRDKYKMDASVMRDIDQRYGPLDWRLPEAHAMYWATVGLQHSKKEELIVLRRVIYQSMNLAFQRGRLVLSTNAPPRLVPNLEIIDKANQAFLDQIADDVEKRDAIKRAHKNFLKDVPYQLFIRNRTRDGEQWLRYLREQYPDAVTNNISLAEYAINRATENVKEQSQVKVVSLIEAFVAQFYFAALEDKPEEANEYILRATELWNAYSQKTKGDQRLAILPIEEMKKLVVQDMLDPERGLPREGRDRLRTMLRMPPEAAPTP
ncbi:MAG TPA: hypothetical protein VK530_19340 [Candidatus Acidoferrum sp.]|nr:hypothetical protein [Candidatus Acidoferrum sp.]